MEQPCEPIRLGALIEALADQPPANHVYFDFCDLRPTKLDSYRGFYDQLAVGYAPDAMITVDQFLADCRAALTRTFQGYKGGDYSMTEKTHVWVSNYGECADTGIVGVTMAGYEGATILLTAYIN